ncbi:NACHT domain-containing protein [Kribbella sp. NPDC050124]|uniref:NACHT domain-containing protein n=1 Tax=Kribbella sp. NPDC050124 TaxID=3364114 RepID=UPI0037AD1BB4
MRRRTWGRRAGWLLLGSAMIAVSTWVVAHALVADSPEDFQRWTNWANVFALPIGMVSAAWLAFDRARRTGRPTTPADQQIDRLIAELTLRLERDWAEEAVFREVTRPRPIRVRWSPTGRRSASQKVTFGAVEAADGDVLGELVSAFHRLPHRQLMVLGAAGAGKSVFAMLLTIGLLRSADAAELPVLLPMNEWDPKRDRVEMFVVRRLVATYADLLAQYGDPATIAERLVSDRRVLPVLDGLDELPGVLHPNAMDALDAFAATARPMVVTCRLGEYARAVDRGRILSQAAVVELEPVDVEDAIRYVSEPVHDARWDPVFERLREQPDGQLAQVLSSPLMVALARTAYQDPASDPGELLSLATELLVSDRLMDAFIAAAYNDSSPRRSTASRRRYPADRAARWLTCLAFHLHSSNTSDLHWWGIKPELMAARPGRARFLLDVTALAMVVTTAFLGTFLLYDGLVAIRAAFAAAAVMAVPAAGLLVQPSRSPERLHHIWLRVKYAAGCGLLTAYVTLDLTTTLPAVFLYTLIAVWLPFWHPARLVRRLSPTAGLRSARRTTASAALQYGLSSAVVFALVGRFTDPANQVFVSATAVAVYGLTAALAEDGRTWLLYQLTHVRLTFQGWLPWRLWRFLDDAHRRGVLRQAGAVYQFRHALLQDHLAGKPEADQFLAGVDAGDPDALHPTFLVLLRTEGFDSAIAFLRSRAVTDSRARWLLADYLATLGDLEGAIAILQSRRESWDRLADLLEAYGRHEQAIALLEPLADAGDEDAAKRLAHALARAGRVDEGIAILQRQAVDSDDYPGRRLTNLMVSLAGEGEEDRVTEFFRRYADSGGSVVPLSRLLTSQGLRDEAHAVLQSRAAAGEADAMDELARRLAGRRPDDQPS